MRIVRYAPLSAIIASAVVTCTVQAQYRSSLPPDGSRLVVSTNWLASQEEGVIRPFADSAAYRAEVALWNAYRIHSRPQLTALLSASFVNVDPGGEANKAEILAGLDNYHIKAVTVDLTGVTQLSESMLLVRSRVRISHDWKGKSLPGELIASTIWNLSSGHPVAVYHQETAGS